MLHLTDTRPLKVPLLADYSIGDTTSRRHEESSQVLQASPPTFGAVSLSPPDKTASPRRTGFKEKTSDNTPKRRVIGFEGSETAVRGLRHSTTETLHGALNAPRIHADSSLPDVKGARAHVNQVLTHRPSAFREQPRPRSTVRHLTELIVPERVRRKLSRLPTAVQSATAPTFGEKTIGQWGSFVYLVNQIFGAGIVALPCVLKVSGWIPCFLANVLVCVVSMFGTLMIMRCMTMIPGNQNFDRRIEYIPTVEYFLGRRFRIWTELCFYISIQSLNVVSITFVAQSLDHLLLRLWGSTGGFVFNPKYRSLSFRKFADEDGVDRIYTAKEGGVLFGITYGYLINAALCIPLSLQNMDENMKVQYISFAVLLLSVFEFSVSAVYRIYRSISVVAPGPQLLSGGSPAVMVRPPGAFGQHLYKDLFSTFIASYSYNNVIPSWANEMTPGVNVNRAVWTSSCFSATVYYLFGFLLAFAYPNVRSNNILQEMLIEKEGTDLMTRCFIYIFNLFTVLPGILVYNITTRYNLVNSGVTTPRQGFFVGCVLPFAFSWILANDTYVALVLQWSSIVFSMAVNFVIPFVVYICACNCQRLASRNPTQHFHNFHIYASRARQDVESMTDDISKRLRDYLRSLPSNEIDPHVQELLDQPSPLLQSRRESSETNSGSAFLGVYPSDTSPHLTTPLLCFAGTLGARKRLGTPRRHQIQRFKTTDIGPPEETPSSSPEDLSSSGRDATQINAVITPPSGNFPIYPYNFHHEMMLPRSESFVTSPPPLPEKPVKESQDITGTRTMDRIPTYSARATTSHGPKQYSLEMQASSARGAFWDNFKRGIARSLTHVPTGSKLWGPSYTASVDDKPSKQVRFRKTNPPLPQTFLRHGIKSTTLAHKPTQTPQVPLPLTSPVLSLLDDAQQKTCPWWKKLSLPWPRLVAQPLGEPSTPQSLLPHLSQLSGPQRAYSGHLPPTQAFERSASGAFDRRATTPSLQSPTQPLLPDHLPYSALENADDIPSEHLAVKQYQEAPEAQATVFSPFSPLLNYQASSSVELLCAVQALRCSLKTTVDATPKGNHQEGKETELFACSKEKNRTASAASRQSAPILDVKQTLVFPERDGTPAITVTPTLDPTPETAVLDVPSNPILRLASIDYVIRQEPHGLMHCASAPTNGTLGRNFSSRPHFHTMIPAFPCHDMSDDEDVPLTRHLTENLGQSSLRRPSSYQELQDDVFLNNAEPDYFARQGEKSLPTAHCSQHAVFMRKDHRLPTTLYLEAHGMVPLRKPSLTGELYVTASPTPPLDALESPTFPSGFGLSDSALYNSSPRAIPRISPGSLPATNDIKGSLNTNELTLRTPRSDDGKHCFTDVLSVDDTERRFPITSLSTPTRSVSRRHRSTVWKQLPLRRLSPPQLTLSPTSSSSSSSCSSVLQHEHSSLPVQKESTALGQSPPAKTRRRARFASTVTIAPVPPSLVQSASLLLPPPVLLSELPVEPPRNLMSPPVEGAEDAYECDEEPTGELKPIRIHVFPKGIFRTYHTTTATILLCVFISLTVASVAYDFVVGLLTREWGLETALRYSLRRLRFLGTKSEFFLQSSRRT